MEIEKRKAEWNLNRKTRKKENKSNNKYVVLTALFHLSFSIVSRKEIKKRKLEWKSKQHISLIRCLQFVCLSECFRKWGSERADSCLPRPAQYLYSFKRFGFSDTEEV